MNQGALHKTGLMDYEQAWELQRKLHRQRVAGEIGDTLILTEHPHTYTLGKTAHDEHLLAEEGVLQRRGVGVYRVDRGGDITYHGPGQIVGYPILDLHGYYLDVHRYLRDTEQALINTLAEYGIQAGRQEGLTGVWVDGAKIAAIGVKVSRWVTMHGFAFNVNTDLSHFGSIVPCGIVDKPVTSLQKILGRKVDYAHAVERVSRNFAGVFGIEWADAKRAPSALAV